MAERAAARTLGVPPAQSLTREADQPRGLAHPIKAQKQTGPFLLTARSPPITPTPAQAPNRPSVRMR